MRASFPRCGARQGVRVRSMSHEDEDRRVERRADDARLYRQWVELIRWLQDYAAEKGLRLDKEADFTSYIYRMERPYELPTTVQTVSLGLPDATPVLIASVSPPVEPLKGVHLRFLGGHQAWHLHAGPDGLMEGKRSFGRDRLRAIADRCVAART